MANTRFTMASIEEFKAEWLSDTPYIEARSSGSTGVPKSIRLLKADMRLSARATNQYFGINASSVLALPLSVDYIAGKMMCVRAWEAGCRLLQLDVSNRFDLNEPVDLLAVVPSQVDHIVELKDVAMLVRNLIIGGAMLSDQRATRLISAGIHAYVSFGMTETCSHIALADITERESTDMGYIYRAMPGVKFDVDSRSCLVIEAPERSFRRLVTNDIVSLVNAQAFRWRGRYDNIINSGGIKLSPEELEIEIATLLPGLSFYIVGDEDERWGEVVALVYEGNVDQAEQIRLTLQSAIDDHRRLPRRFRAVASLPRTTNGKIRRLKISDL